MQTLECWRAWISIAGDQHWGLMEPGQGKKEEPEETGKGREQGGEEEAHGKERRMRLNAVMWAERHPRLQHAQEHISRLITSTDAQMERRRRTDPHLRAPRTGGKMGMNYINRRGGMSHLRPWTSNFSL